MIEWLKPKKSDLPDQSIIYSMEEIEKDFKTVALPEDGYLILNPRSDECLGDTWLKFAVMDRYMSDPEGKNMFVKCIFHGEGPTGSLRECRHTHWGEDGYVFYPNGKIISSALLALSEFYDDLK